MTTTHIKLISIQEVGLDTTACDLVVVSRCFCFFCFGGSSFNGFFVVGFGVVVVVVVVVVSSNVTISVIYFGSKLSLGFS